MLLHKLQPRFDQLTGKPAKPAFAPNGWLCDFCGAHRDPMKEDLAGGYVFSIIESGDMEPQFHELNVVGFPDIDIYSVFNEHPQFMYCMDWDAYPSQSCEREMLIKYMKGRKKSDQHHFSVLDMMYTARLEMLAKIFTAKTYTADELKLENR
jgi:hypothetical protein